MDYRKIIKEIGRGKNHARDLDLDTARWIERCLAGHEPVPQSLKTQMACCLVATREAATLEDGLARVEQAFSE